MKREFLALFLLLIISPEGYGQDKIITVKHDTIPCLITKVKNKSISFELSFNGIKSKATLPLDEVLSYSTESDQSQDYSSLMKNWRFGLALGPSYFLGGNSAVQNSVPDMLTQPDKNQQDAFNNDFRIGSSITADATCMLGSSFGAGIVYRFLQNTASVEGIFDAMDGRNLIYSSYNERVYNNFAGLSLNYYKVTGNRRNLRLEGVLSFGWNWYRNEAIYYGTRLLFTGHSPGINTQIGLEYLLSDRYSVFTSSSYFFSSIKKVKMDEGSSKYDLKLTEEKYENISIIDLKIGFRIYLWKELNR